VDVFDFDIKVGCINFGIFIYFGYFYPKNIDLHL
jgi:hypothetical protein